MAEDLSLQEFESNPERFIHVVRDQQVILDYDLAWLYGVETKVFNQAVKRNIERFPDRFHIFRR